MRATLSGMVRTRSQRNGIEQAVADASGVTEVKNCRVVEAPEVETPEVEPRDPVVDADRRPRQRWDPCARRRRSSMRCSAFAICGRGNDVGPSVRRL